MNIGSLGTGTLTIADGGVVSTVGGPIMIATNVGAIGTLNIGAGAGNAAAAPGTLTAPSLAFGAGTGTLNFNHTSANYVFAPAISGNGTVNVLAGTTTLTAANTYTGGTIISAGRLQLGNGGTSGSITGNVVNNGTFAVNRSDAYVFGGVISGTGTFQQNGTGTTTLTAANTYAGGTTFNSGVASVGADINLGLATGVLTFNGGILQITGTSYNSTARTINWGASRGGFDIVDPANTFTVNQTLTGAGSLIKAGAGTLVLTGANTYAGHHHQRRRAAARQRRHQWIDPRRRPEQRHLHGQPFRHLHTRQLHFRGRRLRAGGAGNDRHDRATAATADRRR